MLLDFNLDRKNLATGVTAVAVALALLALNVNPELMSWLTDEEKLDQLTRAVTGAGSLIVAVLGLVSGNLPKEGA